jgi:hypothetical protein
MSSTYVVTVVNISEPKQLLSKFNGRVPPAMVIRAEHSLVVGCSRDNVISLYGLPKQKSCDEIGCPAGSCRCSKGR